MKTKAQMWGNSLAVRVPKGIAEMADIHSNDVIDIEIEHGHIVLIPRKQKEYSLKSLLRGINKKNLHDQIDTGAPVGRELL